jgi:ribosomal protein L29
MDIKDLKNKSESELHDILVKARVELVELSVKVAENQLKDIRKIRQTKKTIAQTLTLLNAKKAV